jgi:1-acyl-sn-glycerol-3-phosphate acyltransferase
MTRLTNEELRKKQVELLSLKAKDRQDIDFNQTNANLESNKKILTEYYDYSLLDNITGDLFSPISKIWFRPKMVGFDNFPTRNNPQRPLIFAGNHSGMAFPWDAMVLNQEYGTSKKFGQDSFKFLTSPMLSLSSFMNPFQLSNLWKRMGGIDATFENFETLMFQDKYHVMIYPEGIPGIGKGFNNRYQLQEFKTSMVRMSVKYRTEIYPILTINGEYIDPITYSSKWVNKLMNLVGIPFLPLGPITLFIFLQPWVFYIAYPAQLTYVLGRSVRPFDWTNKPYEDISQEEFTEMAEKVRLHFQAEMNIAVEEYGKSPFDLKGLFKAFFKNPFKFAHVFPTSWPIIFTEFERRFKKGERNIKFKTSGFHVLYYLFRNPISISFFIPVIGWIPLIIRGFGNSHIKEARRAMKEKQNNKN